MTDIGIREQRQATLALLDRLIRRGRELLTRPDEKGVRPSDRFFAEVRIWQFDCATAVNELSGGSKAHWLSRAYSSALLVRSSSGDAVVEAEVAEIVFRVLDVLEQGRRSIAGIDDVSAAPAASNEPHRFDFVHDASLRPVLEQAYLDSRNAFDARDYTQAMLTACGILEAILTDALREDGDARPKGSRYDGANSEGPGSLRSASLSGDRLETSDVSTWSFDRRIAAAESAGLIRGGCARLPAIARAYRDAPPTDVSERDARVTRQVLNVVMRDLDPGR